MREIDEWKIEWNYGGTKFVPYLFDLAENQQKEHEKLLEMADDLNEELFTKNIKIENLEKKIEQQQQEIERLNDENNKLKDFIEETDVDRLETASEIINEAMMELMGHSIEDHNESKKDFIKKKKENQESRDRILKSIEEQKQRFELRRDKFGKHFGNIR